VRNTFAKSLLFAAPLTLINRGSQSAKRHRLQILKIASIARFMIAESISIRDKSTFVHRKRFLFEGRKESSPEHAFLHSYCFLIYLALNFSARFPYVSTNRHLRSNFLRSNSLLFFPTYLEINTRHLPRGNSRIASVNKRATYVGENEKRNDREREREREREYS